jgi:hypothetical protein
MHRGSARSSKSEMAAVKGTDGFARHRESERRSGTATPTSSATAFTSLFLVQANVHPYHRAYPCLSPVYSRIQAVRTASSVASLQFSALTAIDSQDEYQKPNAISISIFIFIFKASAAEPALCPKSPPSDQQRVRVVRPEREPSRACAFERRRCDSRVRVDEAEEEEERAAGKGDCVGRERVFLMSRMMQKKTQKLAPKAGMAGAEGKAKDASGMVGKNKNTSQCEKQSETHRVWG